MYLTSLHLEVEVLVNLRVGKWNLGHAEKFGSLFILEVEDKKLQENVVKKGTMI